MFPKMPWKLQELPFRDATRWYKVYATGASLIATEEDLAVWRYIVSLQEQLVAAQNQLNLAGRKNRTPMDPTLGEPGKSWGAQAKSEK